MRYIPVKYLKDGMICGRKLIGKNGKMLINKGSIFQESYINRIKDLGYSRVYIQDELSEDIQINETVDTEVQFEVITAIKNIYSRIATGNIISKSDVSTISRLVENITSQIFYDKNVMLNIVDLKVFDDYTFFHSVNVGILSMAVGATIGLKKSDLFNLGMGAILHDIGKMFIPIQILNKPGKLTTEEFEIIKTHSLKGYGYLLQKFDLPDISTRAVLEHHERFDGTGYPYNKKGVEISQCGSIIAISDVYDALTSDRPYRSALSPSEGMEYIIAGCDTLFNSNDVHCFIRKVAPYPVGSLVKLSNGKIGLVIKNYYDCGLRPKVRVIYQEGEKIDTYTIDLKNDPAYLNIVVVNSITTDVDMKYGFLE